MSRHIYDVTIVVPVEVTLPEGMAPESNAAHLKASETFAEAHPLLASDYDHGDVEWAECLDTS